MRRTIATVAAGVALFGGAGMLAGCSSKTDYQGVCKDNASQQRVDDSKCQASGQGGSGAAFVWIYFAGGQNAPGVGSRVTGGVTDPPEDSSVTRGGVGSSGGQIGDDDDSGGSGGSGDDDGGSGGGDDGGGGEGGGGEGGGGGSGGGGGGGGGGGE